MKLDAAVSPLIAIVVAIGWAVLQGILKRKQDAEGWEEFDRPSAPVPPRPKPPVIPPMTARPQTQAPRQASRPAPLPVTRRPAPVPVPVRVEREGPDIQLAHLNQSASAYQSAARLQQAVEGRMADVDRQTKAHRPAKVVQRERSRASRELLDSFRRPETVRQAFLASFVLNPPKALE